MKLFLFWLLCPFCGKNTFSFQRNFTFIGNFWFFFVLSIVNKNNKRLHLYYNVSENTSFTSSKHFKLYKAASFLAKNSWSEIYCCCQKIICRVYTTVTKENPSFLWIECAQNCHTALQIGSVCVHSKGANIRGEVLTPGFTVSLEIMPMTSANENNKQLHQYASVFLMNRLAQSFSKFVMFDKIMTSYWIITREKYWHENMYQKLETILGETTVLAVWNTRGCQN